MIRGVIFDLGGTLKHASGRQTLAIYSLSSKTYRGFDVDAEDPVSWINGDRSLLFMHSGKVRALEIRSGQVHDVVGPTGRAGDKAADALYNYCLSADERSLFLVRWRNHADIWQVALP